MKKLLFSFFLVLNIFILQAQTGGIGKSNPFKLPEGITSKDYIPNVLVIKFRENSAKVQTFSASQLKTLKSASVLSIVKKFPENNIVSNRILQNPKADKTGLNRVFELKISGPASLEQVINELLADPAIEYAEPHYIHHTTYIPNDPLYVSGQQSYLDIIKAPLAWNSVKNVSGVIIGIVDSGSEIAHSDLSANIYRNTADPVNGLDDDNDGFIDNFLGWDFVGASGTNMVPDNDPNVKAKANDHGVHVSGIAGAVTDNSSGVASVSFNTAKLLIVKAGPDNDGNDILRGYEGVKYAADHGASIINCSWGSEGGGSFGQDIINYAINKGCLIVAAAGNDGNSNRQYPAAYEGVFSIANTLDTDVKASSSNYGDYVTLSAPGSSIMSTVYNNQFQTYSGTSMSSPLVAGAAALVKAALPSLNMLQVGELLRVTSDNIDSKNPSFAGQLGKGRLNVYRALTESPPSVRIQKITDEEIRGTLNQDPDIINLYFDIKNFLFPVTNLQVTLSTTSSLVNITDAQKVVNSLATLESKTLVGPFKVSVPASVASNSEISFRLAFSANSNTYQDYETFSLVVARDYLDLKNSTLNTTITSNGRIGFNAASSENGLGFVYKGDQLLYEASLMIGKSPTMVSNNTRSVNDQYDEHFVKKMRARQLSNTSDSIKAVSEFDDGASPVPLNIYVEHDVILYKQSPNDKYIIAEYEVFNKGNNALTGVYLGLFTDWDILGGSSNETQYISASRLGYVYDKKQTSNYGGVKLLSTNAPPAYYPLSYNLTGNPLSDDDLTIAEKWETLSSGIKATSMGTTTTGIDVSFVSGNGPYDIPANGSIKVAFALVGGDNLQDLENSAQKAQNKYDLIKASEPVIPANEYFIKSFPNPVISTVNSTITVQFSLPEDSSVTLELFNISGQKVRTLFADQKFGKGVYERYFDFSDPFLMGINSGIYFYRLKYNTGFKTSVISILR